VGAHTLGALDQPLGAQHGQRIADRRAGGAVPGHQLGLTGKLAAWIAAGEHRRADQVAQPAHLVLALRPPTTGSALPHRHPLSDRGIHHLG